MSLLTEIHKTVVDARYFTPSLASNTVQQIPSYTQLTPKINFNSPDSGNPAMIAASSDGSMIVAAYQLGNGAQCQFQTFSYISGAWVLQSTITTPLSGNQDIALSLSDQDDLLAVGDAIANEVVVYRYTSSSPALWVQVGSKLSGGAGFSQALVLNSGAKVLAVLSGTAVAFYAVSVSSVSLLGTLSTAGNQTLAISNDFRFLAVGNAYPNSGKGEVRVYARLSASPLTAWSLLQTLVPRSLSATNVYVGNSLSLSSDGSVLAVGCPADALNAPPAVGTTGAVVIYNYASSTAQYVQGQKIIPLDYSPDSVQAVNFGNSLQVSFDGATLVAGGWYDQLQLGSTWVFARSSSGLWIQNANKLRGEDLTSATARQGIDVALAKGNASVVVAPVSMDTPGNVNAIVIFQ